MGFGLIVSSWKGFKFVENLGSRHNGDGEMHTEMLEMVLKGRQVAHSLKKAMKGKAVDLQVLRSLVEGIGQLALLYGCETWVNSNRLTETVRVVEMNSIKFGCEARIVDKLRKDEKKELL